MNNLQVNSIKKDREYSCYAHKGPTPLQCISLYLYPFLRYLSTLSRFSCQIFHPIIFIYLYYCHKALKYLVTLEAGVNHPCRCTEESRQQAGRQNNAEDENRIVLKDEGNISAGFDQTKQAGCLVTGTDDRNGNNIDKLS